MFVEEIRRQAETAPRAALPAIASAMWRAYAEGQITEGEAETLAALIDARKVSADIGFAVPPNSDRDAAQDRQNRPRTSTGSRPRSCASLERRRRWAASGRLPPALASRFTLAEQAALALIAAETARRGDCRLSVPHLAALAGVAETTVRNAIREARKLGLLTVEERRVTGFRNLPNVVRIVSPEWTAWLRLARKGVAVRDTLGREVVKHHPIPSKGAVKRHPLSREVQKLHPITTGGGCKFPNRTPTQVLEQGETRPRQVPKSGIAVPVSPPRSRSRKTGA